MKLPFSVTALIILGLACGSSTHEGDNPGECTDGADNDRDSLFDCKDPECSGAPSCAASTTPEPAAVEALAPAPTAPPTPTMVEPDQPAEPIVVFDFFDMNSLGGKSTETLRRPINARQLFSAIAKDNDSTGNRSDASVLGCSSNTPASSLVGGVLDGRFASTPSQVAVVSNGSCGLSTAEYVSLLVWFPDGGEPVVLTQIAFGTAIATPDMNADGFDDILALPHGSRAYSPYEGVLGTVADGSWRVLQEFGAVSSTDYNETAYIFSVVSQKPGERLLHQVNYICPKANNLRRSTCSIRSSGVPAEPI